MGHGGRSRTAVALSLWLAIELKIVGVPRHDYRHIVSPQKIVQLTELLVGVSLIVSSGIEWVTKQCKSELVL